MKHINTWKHMFFINESDRACHWSCIRITCRCMSFSEETRERERGGGNIWGRMALTASDMERLFSLLLSPDTEVIKQVPHTPQNPPFLTCFLPQATAELRTVYKNPALLGILCNIMLNSEDPHVS